VDFPDASLSPNERTISGSDCVCSWQADNLITSRRIGMIMPEKLNPGPLVERITFFAPFCLIFFFVLIMTIGIIYKIDVHPMHYLFIAGGFFAFHLLFAYMVDLVNLHISFLVSACVTVFLVSRYLRVALGAKFPWKVAFAGQLLYLILFSYSFFIKGMTGLTVTVGSILTLAALMKLTANTNWNEVFAKKEKNLVKPKAACPPAPPKVFVTKKDKGVN
jgi:inner membrane protein involved in colicin E2 resistance